MQQVLYRRMAQQIEVPHVKRIERVARFIWRGAQRHRRPIAAQARQTLSTKLAEGHRAPMRLIEAGLAHECEDEERQREQSAHHPPAAASEWRDDEQRDPAEEDHDAEIRPEVAAPIVAIAQCGEVGQPLTIGGLGITWRGRVGQLSAQQ